MEPMICSTAHRRGPVFSNWKPPGAGEEWLLCDWVAPAAHDQFRDANRTRIGIDALVQSVWRRRSDPSSFLAWPETNDVSAVSIGLSRGSARWTNAGWVQSAHSGLRIRAGSIGDVTYAPGPVDGGIGVRVDAGIPTAGIGAGPLLMELYVEAYPLGRNSRRPHITGVLYRSIGIDTDTPETQIDPIGTDLTDEHPTVSGRVVDTTAGPRRVRLEVRDAITGLFWNEPANGDDPFWHENPWEHRISVTTAADGRWSWTLREELAPGSGRYEVEATGEDAAIHANRDIGNMDPTPARAEVTISTADPDIAITSPAHQTLVGGRGKILGKVSDDRAIERVEVRIKDLFHSQHWNPTTQAWGSVPVGAAADLALDADQQSGTWSWQFEEPPGGSGAYELRATATDAAGRTAYTGIHVFGDRDDIPPYLWIDSPVDGHTFSATEDSGTGPRFHGGFLDPHGVVGRIDVTVEDLGTGEFWDFDQTTWSSAPSSSSVAEMYDGDFVESRFEPDVFGAPGSGDYRASFTPIDQAGNAGPTESVDFHVESITT